MVPDDTSVGGNRADFSVPILNESKLFVATNKVLSLTYRIMGTDYHLYQGDRDSNRLSVCSGNTRISSGFCFGKLLIELKPSDQALLIEDIRKLREAGYVL